MPIVTLAEAKLQLNIPAGDTRDDDELSSYLEALTAVVENETRRVVEQRDFTDYLELYGARSFCLPRVPVADLGAVTRLDDGTDVDLNAFVLTPAGQVLVIGNTSLTGTYQVDYTAGPDTVADNDKRGALVILQHNWELQRGVGNVAAATVTTGDFAPRNFVGFAIPNRAREWLGSPLPVLP